MDPYRDVFAFMQIGQPEACPSDLQPLDAPEDVAQELVNAGITLNALANRFRKLNHPLAFRARLMTEELGEVLVAMGEGNMTEVADGLVDLEYVTVGTSITLGIPHDVVWHEVHRANMAKYPVCETCRGAGAKFPELSSLFPNATPSPYLGDCLERVFFLYAERAPVEDALDAVRLYEPAPHVLPMLNLTCRDLRGMYAVFEKHRVANACSECEGKGYHVLRDAQGKIVKPEGWTPPDIEAALKYGQFDENGNSA